MDEVTITKEQKVQAHLSYTTQGGNPAEVQAGSIGWTVVSGDSTFEPVEGDEKAQWLRSADNIGDTVFQADADADLGEGVVTISKLITLHVIDAMATNANVGFDEPVQK